jgi:hypothetical protein
MNQSNKPKWCAQKKSKVAHGFRKRFQYLMLKVAVGFPDCSIDTLQQALDAGFEFRLPQVEISPDVVEACILDHERS